MYRVGIDVGSTYTKYAVTNNGRIVEFYSEKTPVRQKEYFDEKKKEIDQRYPDAEIISCGYGKGNVSGIRKINELTALASGADFFCPECEVILDIGGQDTKLIKQQDGKLISFFVNDKCAAGSGQFLVNTLTLLDMDFSDIGHIEISHDDPSLSSTCAVFAQSEIVELIADNIEPDAIIRAVITQILMKAKALLRKVKTDKILLSGGLTNISGIETVSSEILGVQCLLNRQYGGFMSAVGCCLQNH